MVDKHVGTPVYHDEEVSISEPELGLPHLPCMIMALKSI